MVIMVMEDILKCAVMFQESHEQFAQGLDVFRFVWWKHFSHIDATDIN